jgi:Flp pilus assembly protein TadG
MRGAAAARLLACRRGVSAVEMALVLTLFFLLLLGVVNFSLVLWTQGSLYYAVQVAARCAAINPAACGSTAATQAYAASQYFGQIVAGVPPAFTPVSDACGRRVSVSYDYPLSIPFYEPAPIVTLSATACFPAAAAS